MDTVGYANYQLTHNPLLKLPAHPQPFTENDRNHRLPFFLSFLKLKDPLFKFWQNRK